MVRPPPSAARTPARRGGHLLARLVKLITMILVGLIVLADHPGRPGGEREEHSREGRPRRGELLVGPFENVFSLKNSKTKIAVNYGLAALVYFIVGSLIARLLRR